MISKAMKLNRLVLSVLVATSVLAGTLVDGEALADEGSGHHEHGNMLDAGPGQAGHAHGDTDDHHDSPTSPCDHHVLHCCCGHVHVLATPVVAFNAYAEVASSIHTLASDPCINPSVERILHIPIA